MSKEDLIVELDSKAESNNYIGLIGMIRKHINELTSKEFIYYTNLAEKIKKELNDPN